MKYTEPKLVSLRNRVALGACATGNADAEFCARGNGHTHVFCTVGTQDPGCEIGNGAGGDCNTGNGVA